MQSNSIKNVREVVATLCAAAAITGAGMAQGSYFTSSSPITEVNAAGSSSRSPSLTQDELYMVFASNRAGGLGGYDLYEASRTSIDGKFGAPQRLAGLSTAADDIMTHVSFNGLELYYVVDDGTSRNIYAASRPDATLPWGPAARLPRPVNDPASANADPYLTKDGLSMFFSRAGSSGAGGIMFAQRAGAGMPWTGVNRFAPANAIPGTKSAPMCEGNGRRVFFAAQDAGGQNDWYCTHRVAGNWIPSYKVDELDSIDGWRRGLSGRLFEARPIGGDILIHVRCYKLVTTTLEYCVDVEMVPVWCPITQTYIYTEVWDWEISEVTTLETYTWSSLTPVTSWVMSFNLLARPLPITGLSGALLLDPAMAVVIGKQATSTQRPERAVVGAAEQPGVVRHQRVRAGAAPGSGGWHRLVVRADRTADSLRARQLAALRYDHGVHSRGRAGTGLRAVLDPTQLAILTPIAAPGSVWTAPVPLPNAAAVLGLRVGLQVVLGPTTSPFGADLTNALAWTLGT